MRKPTMMSLFDGSGGFPLAATMCGITPVAASEVEPYPIAVTKSRFPNMKHLGSVTDVKGNEVEPVDVITFGSPCQDLSVAGKRAGLKHEDNGDEETTRSGLFMEAVRIIKEMREATNGAYPRFAIWENVPGAFSSNKGEDFRTVCEELIKIVEPGATMPAVPKNGWPYADCYCGDGWSLAYRVYDAQYWGVPQRRRRIYLVADFRGECAGQVSFEREGLRGYFTESGTPWQGTATDVERGIGADDRDGAVPYTLKIRSGCEGGGNVPMVMEPICINERQYALTCTEGKANTLTGTDYKGVQLVAIPNQPVFCLQGNGIDRADTAGCNGAGWREGASYTLNTIDRPAVAYSLETYHCTSEEEKTTTLKARDYKDPVCVAYGVDCRNMNESPELYPTLQAKPNGGQSLNFSHAVRIRYIVRRLTPTECARLQGFADAWAVPDNKEDLTDEEYRFWLTVRNTHAEINGKAVKDYTKTQMLTWYNKLHTDGSEYKLWGNGIALPTALYVMQGIADVLNQ